MTNESALPSTDGSPDREFDAEFDAAFDYIVVGGGSAGCIVAARLAEDPALQVALIEAGPSDEHEPRARSIRRWAEMIESEYDLDYRSVPQERGNSRIRQSRMRILGGCSTANTMIAWRPLAADLEEWVGLGAAGWGPENVQPYFDRLLTPIQPVAHQDRNAFVADVIAAASRALDVPLQDRWNDGRLDREAQGAGFFEVGYSPDTNLRSSSSVWYLHDRPRPANLVVLTETSAETLIWDRSDATPRCAGVRVHASEGIQALRARREVIVCAGAIESVRLLQQSGIGPREVLTAADIAPVVELAGVGENLQDHAEGLVVWEATRLPDDTCASGWDAGALLSLSGDPRRPDVVMHFPVEPVVDHPRETGVEFPDAIVAIAPNVAKPSSRGRVWITSADPVAPPSIDYRYFTDPEAHDEAVLVAGVRAARQIAEQEPMRSWIAREVFPGPAVQSDEDISAVQRAHHQTVYHVCGTCRMGSADDAGAVVDPELRVYGVDGLRVVDASVFPTITAVNPVVTIMVVAERAVDLIRSGAAQAR